MNKAAAFQTVSSFSVNNIRSQWSSAKVCPTNKQLSTPITKRFSPVMRTYDVEINLDGTLHKIPVDEDQTLLEGIEAFGLEVLHSCRAGVCVTCAAKIVTGEVDPGFAAITDDLKDDGYVLTCSAYPRSENLKLEMNQFDVAYKRQYGQYEAEDDKK